jgi:hypothetical protein
MIMGNPYEYAFKRLQGKVKWMAENGATKDRLDQWNEILGDLAKGYNDMEQKMALTEDRLYEAEMTVRQLVTMNLKLKEIFKMTPAQEKFVEEVLKFPLGVIEAQVKRMNKSEWSIDSAVDAIDCIRVMKVLDRELEEYRRLFEEYRDSKNNIFLTMLEEIEKHYPELEPEFPKL